MNNIEEAKRWFKDADAYYKDALRNFKEKAWRDCVHDAQLCIEQSAKTIIAFFEEPEWTHDLRSN